MGICCLFSSNLWSECWRVLRHYFRFDPGTFFHILGISSHICILVLCSLHLFDLGIFGTSYCHMFLSWKGCQHFSFFFNNKNIYIFLFHKRKNQVSMKQQKDFLNWIYLKLLLFLTILMFGRHATALTWGKYLVTFKAIFDCGLFCASWWDQNRLSLTCYSFIWSGRILNLLLYSLN